jgi:hypothetical protein
MKINVFRKEGCRGWETGRLIRIDKRTLHLSQTTGKLGGGLSRTSVVFRRRFQARVQEIRLNTPKCPFPQPEKMNSGDQSQVVSSGYFIAPVEPSHRKEPTSVYETDRYGANSPRAVYLLDTFGGPTSPTLRSIGSNPFANDAISSVSLYPRHSFLIPAASVLRSLAPGSRNIELPSTCVARSVISSRSSPAHRIPPPRLLRVADAYFEPRLMAWRNSGATRQVVTNCSPQGNVFRIVSARLKPQPATTSCLRLGPPTFSFPDGRPPRHLIVSSLILAQLHSPRLVCLR